MAAKVKAAYNYSYNYEGKKISFKKDEEFQLLNKSNTDWWQVRRYMDGSAQDIYVPAVYVKEVNEPAPEANATDPTYMNLDDIKAPSGDAGSKKAETGGGGGNTGPPKVLNKPKNRPSFKRGTHTPLVRKEANAAEDKNADEDSPTSPTTKTNGISLNKPVSPSMLRKLGRGGGSGQGAGLSSSQGASMLSGVQRNHSTPASSGPGSAASLPRGEKLAPPPTTSKPRSKTNADVFNEISNSSASDRVSGEGSKGKVLPPVLTKPKPQSKLRRPVSVVGGENEGSPSSSEVGSKPLVSELSNILMKKNPHLAGGEHKSLAATRSLNLPEASSAVHTGGSALVAKQVEVPAVTTPPAPEPAPPPSTALPAGWTEHKTASGQVYYYNAATGQSSWSRPRADSAEADKYLEKVAPRGWTKEINPITSTPVYTNSRTGERWSLASDGKGNYYYYNMANSALTVGELPEVSDTPQENLYDTLGPPTNQNSTKSPTHSSTNATTSSSVVTDTIAASLSDVLKRHGILHRRRLFDSNGKKVRDKSWQKHYVCLQGYELLFYPDMKAKDNGSSPTFIFCLLQSTVSPYNKDKRKNVFQVSAHLGEQFLLQAETSNLFNEWYSTIQSAIDLANHDFKEDPDKFKRSLVERLPDELEEASRIGSLRRDKRPSKGRHLSVTEETLFEGEDETINDFDISAADRSTHIRGRLRKLMAKRPEKEQLRSKGILQDPVFGCELTTLCERQGTSVPRFFVQFIEHIEKVGLDVVGIYRLSGNAASVNKLRYLVEQDEDINLDSPDWSDVNIVTGCMKLYLRELPDPLVPFRMYKPFIDAARASSHPQRVQNITGKVKELPAANYSTLKLLIQHLRRVVEKGHINKMLATNVAIVFGPTVMRAEVDSIEMATLMPIQNGIIEIMVNEYDSIFRK